MGPPYKTPVLPSPRQRKVMPKVVVDTGDPSQHRKQFKDILEWYAVLRRPPETWSVEEAGCWAWMPAEHGGAGMPWLGQSLYNSAIDGHLLLSLTEQQLAVNVGIRDAERRQQAMAAIAELRHLAGGIASGQVLVPITVDPPQPPKPTTRELLLQGLPLPKRGRRKLPWDREPAADTQQPHLPQQPGSSLAVQHPAAVQGAPSPGRHNAGTGLLGLKPQLPQGRKVSYSERERLLAAAAMAAHSLAATDKPSRHLGPLLGAAVTAGDKVGPPPAQVPANKPDAEEVRVQLTRQMAEMARLRSLYDTTARRYVAAARLPGVDLWWEDSDVLLGLDHPGATGTVPTDHGPDQGSDEQSCKPGPQASTQPVTHTSTSLHPAATRRDTEPAPANQQAPPVPSSGQHAAGHQRGGTPATSAGAAAVHQQLQHAIPGLMSVMDLETLIQQGKSLLEKADQVSESLAQADHHDLDAMVTNAQDPLALIDYSTRHTSSPPATTRSNSPGSTAGQQPPSHGPGSLQQWQQWQATLEGQGTSLPNQGDPLPSPRAASDAQGHAQHHPSRLQPTAGGGQHRAARQRPLVYPLPAVAVKEMMDPTGPYSRSAHPPAQPDVYGTRDIEHVRKVLQQGQRRPVQHTLKSQLSEDLVRHVHDLPPRQPGFDQSRRVLNHLPLADREVGVRLALGITAPQDLYLATLDTGPVSRHIVKVLPARGKDPSGPTQQSPQPRPQSASRPSSPTSPWAATSHAQLRQRSSSASPSGTRSRLGPDTSTSRPSSTNGQALATRQRPPSAMAVRRAPTQPIMLTMAYTQTGSRTDDGLHNGQHMDTHTLMRMALTMLDAPTRPPAGPPGNGMYTYDPVQRTHKYRGLKPRWDATPEHQYPLKGLIPPIGATLTKEMAQRLAQEVHDGTRGTTRLHRAAQAGDLQAVADLLHRPGRGSAASLRSPHVSRAALPTAAVEADSARAAVRAAIAQLGPDPRPASAIAKSLLQDRGTWRAASLHTTTPSSRPGSPPVRHASPRTQQQEVQRSSSPEVYSASGSPSARSSVSLSPSRLQHPPVHGTQPSTVPSQRHSTEHGSSQQQGASAPSSPRLNTSLQSPHHHQAHVRVHPQGPADQANMAGETPLHKAAASKGQAVGIMHLLLSAGAEANAQDSLGRTPLHTVICSGCWSPEGGQRVELLLSRGHADPNITDHAGETVLHKAVIYGICGGPGSGTSARPGKSGRHRRVPEAQQQTSMNFQALVRALCAAGARVNTPNMRGLTPLHMAAMKQHRHADGMEACIVRVLLEAGALPNLRDATGRTPLHFAVVEAVEGSGLKEANRINHHKRAVTAPKEHPRAGHWVTRLLVASGGDPNIPDELGRTPLHLAAAAGAHRLARELLKAGANPAAQDAQGQSPAGVAKANGDHKMLKLMKSLGSAQLGSVPAAALCSPAASPMGRTAQSPSHSPTAPTEGHNPPTPLVPNPAPSGAPPVAVPSRTSQPPVTVGTTPQGGKARLQSEQLARLRAQHAGFLTDSATDSEPEPADKAKSKPGRRQDAGGAQELRDVSSYGAREQQAVVKIQAGYRGWRTRKALPSAQGKGTRADA